MFPGFYANRCNDITSVTNSVSSTSKIANTVRSSSCSNNNIQCNSANSNTDRNTTIPSTSRHYLSRYGSVQYKNQRKYHIKQFNQLHNDIITNDDQWKDFQTILHKGMMLKTKTTTKTKQSKLKDVDDVDNAEDYENTDISTKKSIIVGGVTNATVKVLLLEAIDYYRYDQCVRRREKYINNTTNDKNMNLMSHQNWMTKDDDRKNASGGTSAQTISTFSSPLKTNKAIMLAKATSGVQLSNAVGSYESSSLSWLPPSQSFHSNQSETKTVPAISSCKESMLLSPSGSSNTETSLSYNATLLRMLSPKKMLKKKKKNKKNNSMLMTTEHGAMTESSKATMTLPVYKNGSNTAENIKTNSLTSNVTTIAATQMSLNKAIMQQQFTQKSQQSRRWSMISSTTTKNGTNKNFNNIANIKSKNKIMGLSSSTTNQGRRNLFSQVHVNDDSVIILKKNENNQVKSSGTGNIDTMKMMELLLQNQNSNNHHQRNGTITLDESFLHIYDMIEWKNHQQNMKCSPSGIHSSNPTKQSAYNVTLPVASEPCDTYKRASAA